MGAYEYQALDVRGRTRKGVSSGDSARQVRQQLRDKGLTPMNVVAVADDSVSAGRTARSGDSTGVRRTRIRIGELAVITRQFAILLGSGLTVENPCPA